MTSVAKFLSRIKSAIQGTPNRLRAVSSINPMHRAGESGEDRHASLPTFVLFLGDLVEYFCTLTTGALIGVALTAVALQNFPMSPDKNIAFGWAAVTIIALMALMITVLSWFPFPARDKSGEGVNHGGE